MSRFGLSSTFEPCRAHERTLNTMAMRSRFLYPNSKSHMNILQRSGVCADVSVTSRKQWNAFWQNQSFHNYADYALSETFRLGLNRLCELGHVSPCAIMCAEALWWRCHRRIISDYLIANGETVFHILGPNHIEPAHITQAARSGLAGGLIYPADL